MTDTKDNVVRVDFRRKRVVDADEELESVLGEADAHDEPEPAASEVAAATDAAEDEGVDLGVVEGEASKLERFAGFLDHGLVLVTFDTRVDGVKVPEEYAGTPQLHLSFSLRFRVDDFDYDERGVRATLSFDSGPFQCVVPWDAVYGMSSEALDEQLVFPESFPPELLAVLPSLADPPEES